MILVRGIKIPHATMAQSKIQGSHFLTQTRAVGTDKQKEARKLPSAPTKKRLQWLDLPLSLLWTWIQSLIEELRFRRLHKSAKKERMASDDCLLGS